MQDQPLPEHVYAWAFEASHAPIPWRNDEVHLWWFDLEEVLPQVRGHVTVAEQSRAERYRIPRVRDQFLASRGTLRSLLGRYLALAPEAVPLTVQAGGKPVLASDTPLSLHFNVTHSGRYGMVAVAGSRVGVDLEECRQVPYESDLVQRFFSHEERTCYVGLPPALRTEAFFRGWTCKEALLKCVGRGLGSLESCVVDLDPRLRPGIVQFDPGRWQLHTWQPFDGYLAALAVENTHEV